MRCLLKKGFLYILYNRNAPTQQHNEMKSKKWFPPKPQNCFLGVFFFFFQSLTAKKRLLAFWFQHPFNLFRKIFCYSINERLAILFSLKASQREVKWSQLYNVILNHDIIIELAPNLMLFSVFFHLFLFLSLPIKILDWIIFHDQFVLGRNRNTI